MINGSKNKGDWSEFYALLYLIGERQLYSADKNLNRMPGFYFPIQKVIRNEDHEKMVEYVLSGKQSVEIYVGGDLVKSMTSDEFRKEARMLFHDLTKASGAQFAIPHAETFLNKIELDRLGASSAEVTDIKLDLHDVHTGINQVMGFSIKSYVGGAPTLLNASEATNFVFKINCIDDDTMNYVNAIETRSKIVDRIAYIKNVSCDWPFMGVTSKVFASNLQMIDSSMERILADLLKCSYFSNELSCRELIDKISKRNPLHYYRHDIYEYKFKKFLAAKALGMNPGQKWDGLDEANGGYIVVKDDGDVLAYHLYNRNELEQYLFDNTRLERASTSKHNYAKIYKQGDNYYINLNLQIRFK